MRFQRGVPIGAGQVTAARSVNGASVPSTCGSLIVVIVNRT
jgi:hypothetical protein